MVIKKQRRKNQALVRASRLGYNTWAENAITTGADVNCRAGRIGGSPLHWAAVFSDSCPVIRTLVALGANINALDNEGNTPLEAALKYASGAGNTITTLVELGAKLPHNWESLLEGNCYIDSFYGESVRRDLASL